MQERILARRKRQIRLGERRYRTKLELLRDFLAAAQTEYPKTRIMHRANLNQASYARYLSFCQERQLLVKMNGGYALTPQAEELMQSIDLVLSRATDLRIAVDGLNRTARSGGFRLSRPEVPFHSFDHRINLPELLSSHLSVLDRRPQILPRG